MKSRIYRSQQSLFEADPEAIRHVSAAKSPILLLIEKGQLRSLRTCSSIILAASKRDLLPWWSKWVFIATTVLLVDRCWNKAMVKILVQAASQLLEG